MSNIKVKSINNSQSVETSLAEQRETFDIAKLSSKPIFCPELAKEWPSARAAARDLGLTARFIREVANFARESYGDIDGTPLTFFWIAK